MTDLTPMQIDGEAVTTAEESLVRSPFDGHEIGRVPLGTEADVDRAVDVAVTRHRGGALPAHQRAEILDLAAAAIAARNEEFAQSISSEAAKPIATARIEASRAVDTFRFAASVARTFTGEMVPLDASPAGGGKLGFTLRLPVGVVGAISPFNFPLNLVAHKVAPAIAAGCPVVLKPASSTPLTALLLAQVLEDEAGLPAGWLNVVTVPGRVADRLVTHDDVALITFTGSPEVGWSIRARAPRKRVGLELGNNAPVIVHSDADVETAAAEDLRRRILLLRTDLHLGAAGVRARLGRGATSSTGSPRWSTISWSVTLPIDATNVSALIDARRDRPGGCERGGRRGRRCDMVVRRR